MRMIQLKQSEFDEVRRAIEAWFLDGHCEDDEVAQALAEKFEIG